MATVFWDSHGVILIDSFQKDKPLQEHTTYHYLKKLKVELAENRPHLQKRKFRFTKTTHRLTPQFAMAKIHKLGSLKERQQNIYDDNAAIPAVQLRSAFRNLLTSAQRCQGGHFPYLL
ncbi:hypothetical protein TNCV_4994861 [Trichonephila clavipes]|nr:hypothetical protein TNCV_4994861 [Trichonephila clavipes]